MRLSEANSITKLLEEVEDVHKEYKFATNFTEKRLKKLRTSIKRYIHGITINSK